MTSCSRTRQLAARSPRPTSPAVCTRRSPTPELDQAHVFHDLRHTFGTTMAAAGVPMRTLQEWMGHRHISTTERYADYAPRASEGDMISQAFAVATGRWSQTDEVVC